MPSNKSSSRSAGSGAVDYSNYASTGSSNGDHKDLGRQHRLVLRKSSESVSSFSTSGYSSVLEAGSIPTSKDFRWPNDIKRANCRSMENRLASIISDDDDERKYHARAEGMKKSQSAATSGSFSHVRSSGFYMEKLDEVHSVVHGTRFPALIAFLILTNAIFVGVEVEWTANFPNDSTPPALLAIGYGYSAAFLAELIVRLCADRLKFFYEQGCQWNYLDFLLVLVSLGEIFLDVVNAANDTHNASNVKLMRLIRITRLVRVVRVVRVIRFVHALRTLVHSILSTLRSLLWAMSLLTMIIYMFGIVFTQGATTYFEEEYDASVHLYWSSLGRSLFTLFKSVSGGLSWHDAVVPLGQMHPVYVLFFLLFVTFTYFAVLNVVTGVFCQSAVESAHHDYELVIHRQIKSRQMYEAKIKKLFQDMDQIGTGEVTIDEFEKFLESPNTQAYFASLELDTCDAWTLFKLLDADTTHMLDMEEFLQGCLRLRGPAKAIELAKMQYEDKIMRHKMMEFVIFAEASLSIIMADMGINLHAMASQSVGIS